MIKQTVVVEITVDDDNIYELYPNYMFNWNTPEEFINSRIEGIQEDHLEEYGYSLKVLTRDEAKVMDLDLDEPRKTIEDYSVGDLVVYDGLAYQVCDIDKEDSSLKIAGDDELDNGFWVGVEELN